MITRWTYCILFNTNGKLLAIVSDNGTVRLWDVVRVRASENLIGMLVMC